MPFDGIAYRGLFKPPGKAQINWAHPAARYLSGVWSFDGGSFLYDLTGNSAPAVASAAVPGAGGPVGNYGAFGGSSAYTVPAAISGTYAVVAVAMRAVTPGVLGTQSIVQNIFSNHTNSSGNASEFVLGNSFGPTADENKPRWADYAGATTRGWLNGKLQSSENPFDVSISNGQWCCVGGTITGGASDSNIIFGATPNGSGGFSFYLSGGISLIILMKGTPPDALIAELTRNPFGLLSFDDEDDELSYLEADTSSSSGVTATGSLTLPTLTTAATATQAQSATAAIVLAALLTAATASQGQTATGSVTLPAITTAATATQGVTATGATILPVLTTAATATQAQAATAAPVLPLLTTAATAAQAQAATAAFSLPVLTTAAAASQAQTATGSLSFPAITTAATATQAQAAAGAPVLPALTTAATASHAQSAAASTILPAITTAATASMGGLAVLTMQLPALVTAGTASQAQAAIGGQLLPTLALGATAAQAQNATASATLPVLLTAATAIQGLSAIGNLSLPALLTSATATQAQLATGSLVLPTIVTAATATMPSGATGSLVLPVLKLAGTATQAQSASLTMLLPSMFDVSTALDGFNLLVDPQRLVVAPRLVRSVTAPRLIRSVVIGIPMEFDDMFEGTTATFTFDFRAQLSIGESLVDGQASVWCAKYNGTGIDQSPQGRVGQVQIEGTLIKVSINEPVANIKYALQANGPTSNGNVLVDARLFQCVPNVAPPPS